jgi:flagellar assembly factor FliW
MRIATKKFGDIDIEEDSIVHFPKGIIGYEKHTKFALVKQEEYVPFYWLISIQGEEVSLPVLSPNIIDQKYGKKLKQFEILNIHSLNGACCLFCVVNLRRSGSGVTINLKSPIIINTNSKIGQQIIVDSDVLPIDQPVW